MSFIDDYVAYLKGEDMNNIIDEVRESAMKESINAANREKEMRAELRNIKKAIDEGINRNKPEKVNVEGIVDNIKDAIKDSNEEVLNAINSIHMPEVNIDNNNEEVIEAINKVSKDIQAKVHEENVKTYRNIQESFKEFTDVIAKQNEMIKEFNQVKIYLRCTTWFSVITLFTLVIYILYNLGVF